MLIELTTPDLVRAQFWVAGIVGGAATLEDLMRRSISNWLSLAALAAGLVFQALAGGWGGLGQSLLGAVGGFGIFLIFYLLGGMGGGDVKLMAGFGALLGVSRVLEAAFWVALCGGLLAALVLGLAAARRVWRSTNQPRSPLVIPYAPAIALGVWLTLLSSK